MKSWGQIRIWFVCVALLALSGCGPGLCVANSNCSLTGLFDNGSFSPRGMWSGPTPSSRKVVLVGDQVLLTGASSFGSQAFPNAFVGLNTDGSVDSGFHLPELDGEVSGAFADPAGGFFLSGDFTQVDGIARAGFVRLNANGTVDTAFDPGTAFGGVPLGQYEFGDRVFEPAPGGRFYAISPSILGYQGDGEDLTRINADGSIDPGFALPGVGFWPPNQIELVVVTDDGSGDVIVLGGFDDLNFVAVPQGIVRLNSNGTRDMALNPASGFPFGGIPSRAMMIPGTNTFYVAGSLVSYNGTAVSGLIRILGNGALDPTFNTGTGFSDPASGSISNPVYSMIPASDGSNDIYVGGNFKLINGTAQSGIARLNSDGSVDAGFQSGSGFNGYVRSIAEVQDGSRDLFIAGDFTSYDGTSVGPFVRLSADGALRSGFEAPSQFLGSVYDIAPIPGSPSLYAGGAFTAYAGTVAKQLVRLRMDGTLDSTFSIGSGFDQNPVCLLSDASGGLFVGGGFTSYRGISKGGLVRLDASGNLDSSFNPGTGFGGGGGNAVSTVVESSSKDAFWVGGAFTTLNGSSIGKGVARILPSGALDPSFNHSLGGVLGGSGSVSAILPLGDGTGRALLGGTFTQYNSEANARLVLIQKDGTRDTSFTSGILSGSIQSLAKTSNGFMVAGSFATYDGVSVSCGIVRIGADGRLDSSFSPTLTCSGIYDIAPHPTHVDHFYIAITVANGERYVVLLGPTGAEVDRSFPFTGGGYGLAVAVDGSQDLYVGGSHTAYNGTAINGIARISPTGELD